MKEEKDFAKKNNKKTDLDSVSKLVICLRLPCNIG